MLERYAARQGEVWADALRALEIVVLGLAGEQPIAQPVVEGEFGSRVVEALRDRCSDGVAVAGVDCLDLYEQIVAEREPS